MNTNFHQMMKDATRFTRSGRLEAAMAAIRSALQSASPGPVPHPAAPGGDIVLDVETREVDAPMQREEPAKPSTAPQAPNAEGRFIAGASHGREYKLFIPPQAAAGEPLPLVMMLHGCTQDPDDFAAGTRMNDAARDQGFFVLYPAQSAQANPQRCWNWFKHSHQERGRGEPAMLAGMTREILAAQPVDPSRVYVAGLSAGGAMAAIMGEAYPDLFAAVGVHSGLAAGAANDLPSALGAMRTGAAASPTGVPGRPTIVFHGDADATVHPSNGLHVTKASAGPTAHLQVEQGLAGHEFTRAIHRSPEGRVLAEHWVVHGSGHAWSGGSASGSYTDPQGPDATAQMLRFFFEQPRR